LACFFIEPFFPSDELQLFSPVRSRLISQAFLFQVFFTNFIMSSVLYNCTSSFPAPLRRALGGIYFSSMNSVVPPSLFRYFVRRSFGLFLIFVPSVCCERLFLVRRCVRSFILLRLRLFPPYIWCSACCLLPPFTCCVRLAGTSLFPLAVPPPSPFCE